MKPPAIRIAFHGDTARVGRCALPRTEGLLRAMPAARVPQAVRRLHGICAQAQGLASMLAIAAATDEVVGREDLARQAIAVEAEAMRETGLRLCLDWPALVGEAPQAEAARALMVLTQAEVPDVAAMSAWIAGIAASGLPARLVAQAPAHLAPVFEARIAGMGEAPLRIAGILSGAPLPRGETPATGIGVAAVTCARGRLVHRVRVEQGLVIDYIIDAPTARRFAADGDAPGLLARCRGRDEVIWAMHAIDPCVAWGLDEMGEVA